MDDLISKNALLEIINSQLVPDGIAESFAGRVLCRIIASAPTVDAVPVVMCRECIYKNTTRFCPYQICGFSVTDDWFCPMGVRKEDAHAGY